VEQALAREALRLAFVQHKSFAVGLKGVQQERTISDTFDQTATGETLVDMMSLESLVGSGGVLSHAPRRHQAAMMLIDGFQPEGVTKLAVDSIFMMPQLGVLSTIHPKAATEVFEKDCLIHLGTCVAPTGQVKEGRTALKVHAFLPSGEQEVELLFGQMAVLPLGVGETARLKVEPARGMDVGAGKGDTLETQVTGGVVGIILDTRGRPLQLPEDAAGRVAKLREWFDALSLYPEGALDKR
jgi:hypothetical protein